MITDKIRTAPLPFQFKQKLPKGAVFFGLKNTLAGLNLRTVCEEARCPNRTDCYNRGTLAFQILGDLCTRRCGFCAEKTARPNPADAAEPRRVADAARNLKLKHAVITAPARDDLEDGGASQFAACVREIRARLPGVTVEVLTSDFQGSGAALARVLDSRPDIFNHNLETVRRLTPRVRAKATYDRTLRVLKTAAASLPAPCKIKSGLMVGLGETFSELETAFADLRGAGVQFLTVGQYLRPSAEHLPVEKYYTLEEFKDLKRAASGFGFENVFCGPLVRSSYHADEMISHVF